MILAGMVRDGLHHDVANGGGLHGAGSHREAGRVGQGLVQEIVAATPTEGQEVQDDGGYLQLHRFKFTVFV